MLLTYHNPTPTSDLDKHQDRRLHFYGKGESIPMNKSGVWQVYRGFVQLSQLQAHGEEVLLGWVKSATFFGRSWTRLDNYQAKAVADAYLKWYPLQEIEASPELASLVLPQLLQRMQQTEALLAIAGLRRVEERLQELLRLLDAEVGESTPEGRKIGVRFTHQNIANAIGTTRVTVTRLLGDFQRQGWLQVDKERHLIITNAWSSNKVIES